MSKDSKRIIYSVLEYCPLLDSSNMTTDDWGRIGKDIEVLPCWDCCLILVGCISQWAQCILPKLSFVLLVCVRRKTTRTSTASWSSTEPTPWPTRPRPCPSCANTWANPSFWPAHRWKQQPQNHICAFSFSICQNKKHDVLRCPSMRWETTAETTCWGLCSSRASSSSLRWGGGRY